MISRRNFITITIVFIIAFILFQFSQIVRSSENDFLTNDYETIPVIDRDEWQPDTLTLSSSKAQIEELTSQEFILFIGQESSEIGSIVSQWTTYTKRHLVISSKLTDFLSATDVLPEFLIVDSRFINFDKEFEELVELTNQGVSIVFCNLPELSTLKGNLELRKFMGINYIKEDDVTVEGMKLFSGFLLGGETIYEPQKKSEEKRQDLDLSVPWIVTMGGTKTYMVGIMEDYYGDYEYQNEYYPAIIWRNSLGSAQVFCVNGDYMSQTSGLGILSSMIYELSDYQIYPVVNAQNTILVNYPLLANENDEEFKKIYTRSIDQFQNEVVWPTLVTLSEKFGLKYTSLLAMKYDYSDSAEVDLSEYETYLSYFHERGVEVGASLRYLTGTTILEKLEYDAAIYDGMDDYLKPTSAFMSLDDLGYADVITNQKYLSEIRTLATEEDIYTPILSYLTDDITLQSLTSDTKHYTYAMDIRLKSIETTLGFDNAELDFGDVFYPEVEEDQWQLAYKDMSSALDTFWQPFRVFDQTTLTESDKRVRTFLNLDYDEVREDDKISLTVTGQEDEDCYFILRTHGDLISSMKGGSYVEIEDNAYLLTITDNEVTISLKDGELMK